MGLVRHPATKRIGVCCSSHTGRIAFVHASLLWQSLRITVHCCCCIHRDYKYTLAGQNSLNSRRKMVKSQCWSNQEENAAGSDTLKRSDDSITKQALLYKALHNLLPVYLAEDCQLASDTGHRRLCLLDTDTCLVQRTNTRFGDRSFAVAGPRVWNSLPTRLRESDITLEQFRRALKMHLFGH